MPEFVVRFFFENSDYAEALVEAESLERAERFVAAEVGHGDDVIVSETPEGRFLILKGDLRCCQVLPADQAEKIDRRHLPPVLSVEVAPAT